MADLEDRVLKNGMLSTSNRKGFDMGMTAFNFDAWIGSYDGKPIFLLIIYWMFPGQFLVAEMSY